MGSCVVKLHQLGVDFLNLTSFEYLMSKQYTEAILWFLETSPSKSYLEVWCDEDVMIHYNNDNNAYVEQ